jgi:hypothetical protein
MAISSCASPMPTPGPKSGWPARLGALRSDRRRRPVAHRTGNRRRLAGRRAPAGIVRLDSDWLRQLRNRWEAANNSWNQWVLGYNPQRQREVLSRLGWRDPDWQSMTASLAILCGLALLLVTLWTLPRRLAASIRYSAPGRSTARAQATRNGAPNGKARSISRSGWRAKDPILPPSPAKQRAIMPSCATAQPATAKPLRRLQQCVRRLPPRRRKHS